MLIEDGEKTKIYTCLALMGYRASFILKICMIKYDIYELNITLSD